MSILADIDDTLAPTDPRIGALVQLIQGLMSEYTSLATVVLTAMPEADRDQLVARVQTNAADVHKRIGEIAAMRP